MVIIRVAACGAASITVAPAVHYRDHDHALLRLGGLGGVVLISNPNPMPIYACRLISRGLAAEPANGPNYCPFEWQPAYNPPWAN